MKRLRIAAAAGAAGLFALALGGFAGPAQAQYDVPTLSLVSVDRSSITIDITAGASGAPAGFRVDWMTDADYVAMGGWPADLYDPTNQRCDFLGSPTLTLTEGVDSYRLPAGATIRVELGDLFDETGAFATYSEELPAGTSFWIRAVALAPGGVDPGGPWSEDLVLSTMTNNLEDCTYTQGYWKTHPEAWMCTELTVGCVNYTQAELLDIFNTPAAGNGAISLAHQYIAALLNQCNGADVTDIAADLAAAEALLCGLGDALPPVGAAYAHPSTTSDLTEQLDQYNNGLIGPGHCGEVQNESTTWGRAKALYR